LTFEQDRTMETLFGSGLFEFESSCSDSKLARAQLGFDAWKLLVQACSKALTGLWLALVNKAEP